MSNIYNIVMREGGNIRWRGKLGGCGWGGGHIHCSGPQFVTQVQQCDIPPRGTAGGQDGHRSPPVLQRWRTSYLAAKNVKPGVHQVLASFEAALEPASEYVRMCVCMMGGGGRGWPG